ncbi:MAG: hypothetical protein JNL05_09365 [Flavobacteriales bacterium]|nr:hypothetical protein [Flavobacteriales bacterium]
MLAVEAQNVGINVTGVAPNASALLDLDVSGLPANGKRGMMIPRMTRADRLAIAAPPAGLWVYQTDDGTYASGPLVGLPDPAEERGYWYWEGAPTNAWVRWATGRNSWQTTGNTGTTPATNYLGTSVAQPLIFRTTSPLTADPQMHFPGTGASTGFLSINHPVGTAVERLDVNGGVRVLSSGAGGGSATDLEGTIRFTGAAASPNRWHFGSMPMITRTGSTVLGSPTVTMTSTAGITVGMNITAYPNGVGLVPGLPAGTTVVAIVNATTLTVSANAVAGGNQAFGFTTAPGNWARLENAEQLITVGGDYAKDTLICAGTNPGFVVAGPNPGDPGGINTTANNQTPFATNFSNVFPVPCGPVVTLTCTTTAGSTTVTTASTAGLAVGRFVGELAVTFLPAGTITIASIVNATTFTLNVAAVASGTTTLYFAAPQPGPALSTAWAAPFAGATGRGFRSQYVYTAAELSAAGMCSGYITALGFFSLDDDCSSGNNPVFTQGNIDVEVRIGNTALNDFSGNAWDQTVRTSLPRNVNATAQNMVVSAGWNMIPLTINPAAPGGASGFFWDGISNICVDWCWQKSTSNARSPRVWAQTFLPQRARIARHGTSTTHGKNYNDAPITPTGLGVANESARPVTRFAANTKVISTTASTANYILYEGGLMIGNAGWSATAPNYRGPGTIHARSGVYDGNLQLNDHVFDRYFDGTVRTEDVVAAEDHVHVPLNELKPYLAEQRHLPNLPSRSAWESEGMPSVGGLQNGLWRSVETQALYIAELERDLSSLERLAFGDGMTRAEADALRLEIQRSPRLTEQQKLHLNAALEQRIVKQ